MAVLTIFSAPKPFTNPHIALIQRNAIRSWLQLGEQVDVILIGDEPGLSGAAQELGVRVLPEVKRSEQGTPLVSHIFELARQNSSTPLMAYVNADVILMCDFLDAALVVAGRAERFLCVGQRWDLDVREPLQFEPEWENNLREEVRRAGRFHPAGGSDYFIYPVHMLTHIPDFAIGRAGWDNWIIYETRRRGWTVVDCTPSVMVVHQDHDYSHLPGGKAHYTHEESERNRILAGGKSHMFILLDANRRLVYGSLRRLPFSLPWLIRKLEVLLMPGGTELKGRRWEAVWKLRRLRLRLERGGR